MALAGSLHLPRDASPLASPLSSPLAVLALQLLLPLFLPLLHVLEFMHQVLDLHFKRRLVEGDVRRLAGVLVVVLGVLFSCLNRLSGLFD
jgi:hypothetical protein